MKAFMQKAPRYLFFTGKGGVGKTSMACATAVGLAEQGRRVLLISTDPASNLDEVLQAALSSRPTPVPNLPGLSALNIDPIKAAAEYRERMVGPYRGVLPKAAVTQMEEQLSGACTVEIAGFNEFSKLLGDDAAMRDYDHVVLDTAPTGHTLLLLDATRSYHRQVAKTVNELPEAVKTLLPRVRDPRFTKVIIVALPEATPTHEASALQADLVRAGIQPWGWIINRSFAFSGTRDPALCAKGQDELAYMDEILERHARKAVIAPWVAQELNTPENLRHLYAPRQEGATTCPSHPWMP